MKTLEQECFIKIQELHVPFDTIHRNVTFKHRVVKKWRVILGHIAMKCTYFDRKLEVYATEKTSVYNE